jgi:hypothetical protein
LQLILPGRKRAISLRARFGTITLKEPSEASRSTSKLFRDRLLDRDLYFFRLTPLSSNRALNNAGLLKRSRLSYHPLLGSAQNQMDPGISAPLIEHTALGRGFRHSLSNHNVTNGTAKPSSLICSS